MDETQRPGLVVFVIVTDGQENSSREFSKASVKKMIERQQNEFKWQFQFLGANQDAFAEAGGIGIAAGGTASYDVQHTQQALSAASSNTLRMRSAAFAGQKVENRYTDDELRSMK